MKNLNEMLVNVIGVKSKEGFSVNSVLFEILKDGKKLSREELKLEMLKFRFISKFGEFKDEYFKDEKMLDEIKKLSVVSRNSIDSIISKNNSNFIFKDIKGFEKCKVVLENNKYFIK
jgi:esterase/lipase